MPRYQRLPKNRPTSPEKAERVGSRPHSAGCAQQESNRFPLISSGRCSPSPSHRFLQWRVPASTQATLPVGELRVSNGPSHGLRDRGGRCASWEGKSEAKQAGPGAGQDVQEQQEHF